MPGYSEGRPRKESLAPATLLGVPHESCLDVQSVLGSMPHQLAIEKAVQFLVYCPSRISLQKERGRTKPPDLRGTGDELHYTAPCVLVRRGLQFFEMGSTSGPSSPITITCCLLGTSFP